MRIKRIAPQRAVVQGVLIALYLLLPLFSLHGNPLFRIDLLHRTIYLAATPIRVDQLYLMLFASLLVLALFLLLTVLVGRVWCGWMCPQTLVNDLAESCQLKLRSLLPAPLATVARHLVASALALLFASATLWWFISPAETVIRLTAFFAYPITSVSFLLVAILVYLDIILVGRGFCKALCPYGRFQMALQDAGTLNLALVEETRHACIGCGSCLRACPMGIDIRNGFQVECINCGRCIDACRSVMQRSSCPQGLIAYRFGTITGARPRFGFKSALLLLLVLLLTGALVAGLAGRSDNAFSVQRNPQVESKISSDGYQIQAWRAIIGNRGELDALYSLSVVAEADNQAQLLGPVSRIALAPNENTTVSFFLKFRGQTGKKYTLQLTRDGRVVAATTLIPL